jgi:hypothetical protein
MSPSDLDLFIDHKQDLLDKPEQATW